MSKKASYTIIEMIRFVIYFGAGVGFGIIAKSDMASLNKWIIYVSLLGIVVISGLLLNVFLHEPTTMTRTISGQNSQSITDKNNQLSNQMTESRITTKASSAANMKVEQINVGASALDRRPLSTEKKAMREQNRKPATKLVLLNEEGTQLLQWSLQNATSLIIGKSTEKAPVDIDLSVSAMAYMISKQHAVLNYTEKGWYIDDIDSKNGTRVKKASQNAIMDIKLVGAVEVESGDIIYIANTMLQIQ